MTDSRVDGIGISRTNNNLYVNGASATAVYSVSGSVSSNNLYITVNGVRSSGIPLPETEVFFVEYFGNTKDPLYAIENVSRETAYTSGYQPSSISGKSFYYDSTNASCIIASEQSSHQCSLGFASGATVYDSMHKVTADTTQYMSYAERTDNTNTYRKIYYRKASYNTQITQGYVLFRNLYIENSPTSNLYVDAIVNIASKKIKLSRTDLCTKVFSNILELYITSSTTIEYHSTEPSF